MNHGLEDDKKAAIRTSNLMALQSVITMDWGEGGGGGPRGKSHVGLQGHI